MTKETSVFEDIKGAYRKNQILLLFDYEKQIWVHADASDYAIGSVISQKDDQGRRRPVLFYSRKLLPAEMNYTTADKEMLEKFRHTLQGTKFSVIVKSDHKNLRTFMTVKDLNARQARWAEELSAYDFRIEHIKGKENTVADALSRRADYREGMTTRRTEVLIEDNGALVINKHMKLNMITLTEDEKELGKEIKEETKRSDERVELIIEEDGYKRFNGLIFVPKKMENKLIKRLHDDVREGHPGVARTMEKTTEKLLFPRDAEKSAEVY
jgi:RNase H-like domain found in reverse transcriptase